MKYVKIVNRRVIEAPSIKKTEDGVIYGYSNSENYQRLTEDGWIQYDRLSSRLSFNR